MESNQFHVMPKQKHIGSRTHKDVKEGKIIRIDEDGFENFSDYWTDPDTPQSPASVHIKPSVNPDNRKNQAKSDLALGNESTATMSPFTPTQDEFTSLQINSLSGISKGSGQPSDANSLTVPSCEENILATDNSHVTKTVVGNIHQAESYDVATTLELPKMVTEHRSKIPERVKGIRATIVEADGDQSDGVKGLKSSDVATTSTCERRVGISQDPLCTELPKDRSYGCFEKCLDQSTVASKAIINPVVVLHDLSPRCSVLAGTTGLTVVSFPLNTKGDIAGTISRPTTILPSSTGVHQTSPEIVKPTRKRLTYSPESPVSSNIFQGTQQGDVAHSEINGIVSSSLSPADKRIETDVLQQMETFMVAETSNTKPGVSKTSVAKYEEFPVVSRQRKSHCQTEIKPKDITNGNSPSSVTNVVASVGRSLHLESAQNTRQSETFSNEAQAAVPKDSERQIPAENEIEVDNLQDTEICSEADNEAIRNVQRFDLFEKASSSLVPTHDMIREDDDLVADGKEGETLIFLPSRSTEERDHGDADDRNNDDDDDFQMAPLSQVKTVKLNYSAMDINVDSKKVKKAAKTKAESDFIVLVSNSNSPDSMDVIEHTLVGEQNEIAAGSQTILEKPDSTKSLTVHESSSRVARSKIKKARKEAFITNEGKNKTSSDAMRRQGGATSMDVPKNLQKNGPKPRMGYKRMKEIQPPDILRKRRKRTPSSDCNVSEQGQEDLSTEAMNQHFRSNVPSQSVCRIRHVEARKEEDISDPVIITTERRKSVISSECERSPGEETEEENEERKIPGCKTNAVRKAGDTIQKGRTSRGKSRHSSSKNNMIKSLTDSFKKNTRTKGKNRRIIQPQTIQEGRRKQSKGKHNEDPTVLDPVSIKKSVADSDYSSKKNTVLKEDQARDSEHLMIACGQMGKETTGGTVVYDLRQSNMLHNVSNIEPAKTNLGSNLIQYVSTPKNIRRSRRRAAAVAKQRSSLMLGQAKQKRIKSVSRQSLVSKQTEREKVSPSLEDTPDAQNSSDLHLDDPTVRRKFRKSTTLQKQPFVSVLNGVENKDNSRITQRNVTKTPETRLSVASPLHYFDSTVSHKKSGKQKLCKIFPPAGNDAGGFRRSRRTRVKALDWFRNERIHYERRESGFVVAGIYSPKIESKFEAAEKVVKKVICKEKLPEQKRHTERNLSIHADLSHSLLPRTQSEIKVVNPQTQEEVFVECVKTLDQAKMVGVSGKPPTDDEPLLLCKPIRQKTFASGTLIIRPLQIKKMQFVQNDTMLFHVIHGKVEVTIHQTNFVVESRDKFFVPVGNSYSIRNLRNEDAELDFTQIKS